MQSATAGKASAIDEFMGLNRAVASKRSILDLISKFHADDIYAADEVALFYRLLPQDILSERVSPGIRHSASQGLVAGRHAEEVLTVLLGETDQQDG